jgi:ArsR family transcriptional regulator, arsenate/arsenite/antimonite-responsive transcriptional repressor
VSQGPQQNASEVQLSSDEITAISRALAEPRRFAMLQQIARQAVLSCSALDAQDCISPATVSHHLKELQNAGLITAERDGRAMRLALRRDVWDAYLRQLATL